MVEQGGEFVGAQGHHLPSQVDGTYEWEVDVLPVSGDALGFSAKEGAKASSSAKRLIEGSKTCNWKQAMNQLSVAYPDRFAAYL